MNQKESNDKQPIERKEPLSTALIQKYYKEIFDPSDLLSIIGLSDFYRREFAFLLEDGSFIRNTSFKSSSALTQFMTDNPIRRSYVGAVYELPPSKTNTIQKINFPERDNYAWFGSNSNAF